MCTQAGSLNASYQLVPTTVTVEHTKWMSHSNIGCLPDAK